MNINVFLAKYWPGLLKERFKLRRRWWMVPTFFCKRSASACISTSPAAVHQCHRRLGWRRGGGHSKGGLRVDCCLIWRIWVRSMFLRCPLVLVCCMW